MAENKIFSPFPWYNDRLLRNHYKTQCLQECQYKLLTPNKHFLPFQVTRPTAPGGITGLVITCPDGTSPWVASPDVFQIYSIGDTDYIVYDGRELSPCDDCDPDTEFPCGWLVATMTDGLNVWYSEMFWSEAPENFLPENNDNLLQTETGELILTESGDPIIVQ